MLILCVYFWYVNALNYSQTLDSAPQKELCVGWSCVVKSRAGAVPGVGCRDTEKRWQVWIGNMYHAMNASSGSHYLELWMLSSLLHHHSQGAWRGLWRCKAFLCMWHTSESVLFKLERAWWPQLTCAENDTHENDTRVHLHEVWKIFSVTNTKCLRLWPIYTDIISEIFLQSE